MGILCVCACVLVCACVCVCVCVCVCHNEKKVPNEYQANTTSYNYKKYNNKIASRYGAPRPPMTDVGTETAFRLDQRKHFRKVNIS